MLSDLDGRVEKWFALLFHSKKVWGLNPLSNLPETLLCGIFMPSGSSPGTQTGS